MAPCRDVVVDVRGRQGKRDMFGVGGAADLVDRFGGIASTGIVSGDGECTKCNGFFTPEFQF